MDASYPDLGSINDSKEGGLEGLEEVREGAGEGGHESIFGGAPLPKYLGKVSGNCCGVASQQGPHICSIAELLHSNAMQQMEVALLGLEAAKLLDILLMSMQSTPSTQHQATLLQPQTVHYHPLATTSISSSPPTIPIVGVMDTKGPTDATAISSGVQTPTSPAQKEPMTSKCQCIILMPIPPHNFKVQQPLFPSANCCGP